jgi:hypothetical protein
MSIGSRTVKRNFIFATIYLFSSNFLSSVAKHDWRCMQFSDPQTNLHVALNFCTCKEFQAITHI